MQYEWDETKRLSNLAKHGFDFISSPEILSKDHFRKSTYNGKDGEIRWMATGVIHGRYATLIYTMRGETIRPISLRSASHGEKKHYQDLFD